MLGKYKIKFVSDAYLGGYDGMNYEAAKLLGFDKEIGYYDILVNETVDFMLKIHTVIHEIAECERLRNGETVYWKAHEYALIQENKLINLRKMLEYVFKSKKIYNMFFSLGVADSQL